MSTLMPALNVYALNCILCSRIFKLCIRYDAFFSSWTSISNFTWEVVAKPFLSLGHVAINDYLTGSYYYQPCNTLCKSVSLVKMFPPILIYTHYNTIPILW